MGFAENLKSIRKQRGVTQEQLAELLNVSRQAVSKWESENGYPEIETLLIISKELQVSLDILMRDELDLSAQKAKENAKRYSGFAHMYEEARPVMPTEVVDIVCRYLGRTPDKVADIGSGTGLSTVAWQGRCNKVIGIEPSADMYQFSLNRQNEHTVFYNRFARDTGLDSQSVDVVVCSQSFHWMEPVATLQEVNRILKKGGVFVTVDCDWPPLCTRRTEEAYRRFFLRVKEIKQLYPEVEERFGMWRKDEHLKNIEKSGYFSFVREAVFSTKESCDSHRFVNIALSQASVQNILKYNASLIEHDIRELRSIVAHEFVDMSKFIQFNYRMRIGIK